VPAAVALAVVAAFVHGFVSSGSQKQEARALVPHARVPDAGSSALGRATTPEAAPAAPAHRAVRKTVRAYSDARPASTKNGAVLSSLAGVQAQNSVVIPKNRLVHAVASLEVQVKTRTDLSKETNEATQDVSSLGGYAQSVRYQASHDGGGSAVLALRVPVQKAQTAIARLGGLGILLSQQVSTQDLQAKLTQQTSQVGSLRRSIAVYETALQSTTLPASQRVIIQIRLNNARHQLSRLRHARTGTLASGATADISLLLTTHNGAVAVTHHHGNGRFGRLLGSAAGFLGLEGIIVLYGLVVLSPLLLLGALGWWILRERRRREERLLARA
jgi:hypothetical protein